MLKLFRKFAGPCVLMAVLAGCGGMDMTGFVNASAVPTNTDIPFRSGIQYSAPRGFCATDAQTYQEEAKGFGVFVTCFGAYDRSRLLTVAHYPIDPDNPPATEILIQAAGFGAKAQRIVEKDEDDPQTTSQTSGVPPAPKATLLSAVGIDHDA